MCVCEHLCVCMCVCVASTNLIYNVLKTSGSKMVILVKKREKEELHTVMQHYLIEYNLWQW